MSKNAEFLINSNTPLLDGQAYVVNWWTGNIDIGNVPKNAFCRFFYHFIYSTSVCRILEVVEKTLETIKTSSYDKEAQEKIYASANKIVTWGQESLPSDEKVTHVASRVLTVLAQDPKPQNPQTSLVGGETHSAESIIERIAKRRKAAEEVDAGSATTSTEPSLEEVEDAQKYALPTVPADGIKIKLKNIGSTCWMNSVVKFLSANDEFDEMLTQVIGFESDEAMQAKIEEVQREIGVIQHTIDQIDARTGQINGELAKETPEGDVNALRNELGTITRSKTFKQNSLRALQRKLDGNLFYLKKKFQEIQDSISSMKEGNKRKRKEKEQEAIEKMIVDIEHELMLKQVLQKRLREIVAKLRQGEDVSRKELEKLEKAVFDVIDTYPETSDYKGIKKGKQNDASEFMIFIMNVLKWSGSESGRLSRQVLVYKSAEEQPTVGHSGTEEAPQNVLMATISLETDKKGKPVVPRVLALPSIVQERSEREIRPDFVLDNNVQALNEDRVFRTKKYFTCLPDAFFMNIKRNVWADPAQRRQTKVTSPIETDSDGLITFIECLPKRDNAGRIVGVKRAYSCKYRISGALTHAGGSSGGHYVYEERSASGAMTLHSDDRLSPRKKADFGVSGSFIKLELVEKVPL